MKHNAQPQAGSLFTQVEVTASTAGTSTNEYTNDQSEQTRLLRAMLTAQERQNELLEELVSVVGTQHRQRASELAQWKQANPALSRNCRKAAETLGQVHSDFLSSLTQEVAENSEGLLEGDFFLNEFVDRFGPRLAHLNGVLQVLSQLGGAGSQNAKANRA
ncbi:MAG: hypothetical protein AB7O62_18140 [Pirellulales bacterium]